MKSLQNFLILFYKTSKKLRTINERQQVCFYNVDLLHYKCHKTSLNCGRKYIYSPKWLKNKKATINPKNSDVKCFQYAITVALNHKKIGRDPQRISKIKPFIDQYNWKEISFSSHKKKTLDKV